MSEKIRRYWVEWIVAIHESIRGAKSIFAFDAYDAEAQIRIELKAEYRLLELQSPAVKILSVEPREGK